MSAPTPEQRVEQWQGVPCEENKREGSLLVSNTMRVWFRLEHDEDWLLVDFAMGQQTHHHGTWRDVMRADCCHGTVHVHRYSRRGKEDPPEHLRSIGGQADIDLGYALVETLINAETCEANERRWRDG
jgi:hypothetical protein